MKNLSLNDFQEVYDEVMNNRKVGLSSAIMYDVDNDKLFAECLISENDFIIYSEHIEHVDLDYYMWKYQDFPNDVKGIIKGMYKEYMSCGLTYVGKDNGCERI